MRQTSATAVECSEPRKGNVDSGSSNSASATKAMELRKSAINDHSSDRVLGECSLNLVEVVSGRAPHIEDWVPLDSGGDLRLCLDYDSVGTMPAPGDSVRGDSGTCCCLCGCCFCCGWLVRGAIFARLGRPKKGLALQGCM